MQLQTVMLCLHDFYNTNFKIRHAICPSSKAKFSVRSCPKTQCHALQD